MRAIAAPSGAASAVQMPLRRAPRRRTRFAVMAPTLVHFCTKFAEKKEGLARQKRLERHYRWVARVPVRAARFANATDMAATARAAPPHPAAAANVPSHTEWRLTLALTLFCRAGPVRRYGRAAVAACATAAAAVAFANLQNALRGTAARGASVAPYALRYSCCRHCRLLLLYRLSHRLLLLLLLLQTRLAIYTLCVQYTKQDRNAQCNVRNFFYDAFFLMYFLAADSKWSNKFLGGYFV